MMAALRRAAFVACLALLARAGVAGEPTAELHGMADAFAAPGVALAWGVLRGSGDAATVVMRIAVDSPPFAFVGVDGIDPFTAKREPVLAARAAGRFDVPTARAHFADYPRTEVRLFKSEAAMRTGAPDLVVYYLGVPDTTPEFTDEGKLVSDLDERIRRARANQEGKAR